MTQPRAYLPASQASRRGRNVHLWLTPPDGGRRCRALPGHGAG